MKTMHLIFGLLVASMISCQSDQTREFMPGTYVNTAGGKYSLADDTLEILPAEGNSYLIERRTGFNRITDGVKGKREYEKESWNTVYDQNTRTLQETSSGKLLTFYPDSAYLKVGRRLYKKIAD